MQLNKRNKIIVISVSVLLVAAIVASALINQFSNNISDISVISDLDIKISSPKRIEENIMLSDTGFYKVAEDDKMLLEYSREKNIFNITDLSTGKLWSSAYNYEKKDELNGRERRLMTALLSVNYLTLDGNEETVSNTEDSVSYIYNLLENGIEIIFDFTEQGFSITLQIYLGNGGFYATIPENSVKENNKDYSVVSIDVLPAWGSMMNGEDGYIVYPDGCGTILDCNNVNGKSGVISTSVYAEPYSVNSEEVNDIKISIPYFGSVAKYNNSATCGYILKGTESSRIAINIGNTSLPLCRIYPSFVMRYKTVTKNSKGAEFSIISDLYDEPFCAFYSLIQDKEASYSGIANAVRKTMSDNNILSNETKYSDTGTYIELLLGTENTTISSQKTLVMTSYEEAYSNIEALSKDINNNLYVNLLGWQDEGFNAYPSANKFSSLLGTKSELNKLLSIDNGKDVFILLQNDYLKADVESNNINTRQDIVYNNLNEAIISTDGNSYLRNPRVSYNQMLSDMDYYADYKVSGLAFESFSSFISGDFTDKRYLSLSQCIGFYKAFLKTSFQKGYFTASQGGNDYLYKYSDFTYNIPETSSNLEIWDKDIPMLQLILHGKIGYAGSLPGNMSSNLEKTRLKWAETGMTPYFLLTEQNSSEFTKSHIDDIFNSKFDDWYDYIVTLSNEFDSELKDVRNSEINEHKYIYEDLVCVSYANGYKVYVNYSDNELVYESISIPAKDFLVVKQGGK